MTSKQCSSITIDSNTLPLTIRKLRRARRMTLRYDPANKQASLSLPLRTSIAHGMRFVEERRAWLAEVVRAQPEALLIADGSTITLFGQECTIKHLAGERGVAQWVGGTLLVPGAPEFLARRTKEALMRLAKERFEQVAQDKASQLGVAVRRITVKDTQTRWGSCSADGNIALSWRLALAPVAAMEYVISHEVAHVVELNHSRKFWAVVARIQPDYKQSVAWFKTCGSELYRYSF